MTTINSLCLYYISFSPLWLAILFVDIKNIIDKDVHLYTEKISIISIIILFIISVIIVYNFMSDKRKSNVENIRLLVRKNRKILRWNIF